MQLSEISIFEMKLKKSTTKNLLGYFQEDIKCKN